MILIGQYIKTSLRFTWVPGRHCSDVEAQVHRIKMFAKVFFETVDIMSSVLRCSAGHFAFLLDMNKVSTFGEE